MAYKVALLGMGGIGQSLSLLLKTQFYRQIKSLSLYDLVDRGVGFDLSHIPTSCQVSSFKGLEQLPNTLDSANVVVITAGLAIRADFKEGQTFVRDELFDKNAQIQATLITACAKICPKAHILIVSNPVNSLTPLAHEIYAHHGIDNPSIFGVNTLDVIRAHTFIGQLKKIDPSKIKIDIIGGHSRQTIVPLFSTVKPFMKFSEDQKHYLTNRIKAAGQEVVKAKSFKGSATFSTAYSTIVFLKNLLDALDGKKGIIANSYVYSPEWKDTEYFSGKLELGPQGLSHIHQLPPLQGYEQQLYDQHLEPLKADIQKGISFAQRFLKRQSKSELP